MNTVVSWRAEKKFPRPSAAKMKKMFTRAAEIAGSGIGEKEVLSVSFLSSEKMAEVNMDYLTHKGDTDVICFDYRQSKEDSYAPETMEEDCDETVAVELLICPAAALREAEKRGLPFSRELTLYVCHGLLHAAGFDDLKPELKRRMRAAERRVMSALEKEFTFSKVFPDPEPPQCISKEN